MRDVKCRFESRFFYEKVGQALDDAIAKSGMTRKALAKECGVAQSTIDHAIDGTGCSLQLFVAIAEALDVPLDVLVPLEAT